MAKKTLASIWARALGRSAATLRRQALRAGKRAIGPAVRQALKPARSLSTGPGAWLSGLALCPAGARRYRLYRPAGVRSGESLPLLVMLHGCGQDAERLASSTRMNRVAERGRFLVLYPEQERLANAQGCWNWFDTRGGRAQREAASVLAAIDQVCATSAADRSRVAVAGLSAGASLAALLATEFPTRFRAVVMHSGMAPGSADSTLSALAAMRGRRGAGHHATVHDPGTPAWPPLLVIQGGLDPLVAPSNAATAVAAWATAAGAKASAPRVVQRGQRYPMAVTDFRAGRRLVATLVLIDRLAHAWSGGAAGQPFSDPRGPDASRLLWAFVSRNLRD